MCGQVGVSSDQAASEVYLLRKAIEGFNAQASKQTKQMIRLNHVIAWLTAIMAVLVGAQVYLVVFG